MNRVRLVRRDESTAEWVTAALWLPCGSVLSLFTRVVLAVQARRRP